MNDTTMLLLDFQISVFKKEKVSLSGREQERRHQPRRRKKPSYRASPATPW
jgi:hypothetical protein